MHGTVMQNAPAPMETARQADDSTAIAIADEAATSTGDQRPDAPPDEPKSPTLSRVPLGPVRKNGLERPYSSDQVIACAGHLVSAVCVYVAIGVFLLHSRINAFQELQTLSYVMLGLHVPSMVLLVAAWVSCERIDPARPIEETLPNGWLGYKLKGARWEKARYCAVCRKAVPGLDHHCTWLQTCVGKSNYAQFFTIACTGTLQFLTQALFASFCLVWLDLPFDPASDANVIVQGVLVVILLISVPCTLMYFILLGFHVYLYFLGYGTYEWMLRRRRKQRARAAAAAAACGGSASTSTTTSKRSAASRVTQREAETSESRDSRFSSVSSANKFVSADDAPRSQPRSSRELTSL